MASYSWSITDKSLLQQVKSAKNGKMFKSPLFNAFNHRWYLKLAPNYEVAKQGTVQFWLYMVDMPLKVQYLRLDRTQSFIEGDYCDEGFVNTIKQDQLAASSWPNDAVKPGDLQKHDRLTFKVEFDILAAYDQDDKDILNLFQSDEMKNDDEGLRKENESLKVESLCA